MIETVKVIGAGLAGVEAAWQCAKEGFRVELYEMKPKKFSPAHKMDTFAELVCSNSLKAKRVESAAGLLKEEMRRFGSLCVECAYETEVAAGGALAVDRDEFSKLVTKKILSCENITVINEEVREIPDGNVIIAAGPLASDALSEKISALCGNGLHFFDAAAPIITAESIDKECSFAASRYDRGGDDDYINCPMNKEQYEKFYNRSIQKSSGAFHGEAYTTQDGALRLGRYV